MIRALIHPQAEACGGHVGQPFQHRVRAPLSAVAYPVDVGSPPCTKGQDPASCSPNRELQEAQCPVIGRLILPLPRRPAALTDIIRELFISPDEPWSAACLAWMRLHCPVLYLACHERDTSWTRTMPCTHAQTSHMAPTHIRTLHTPTFAHIRTYTRTLQMLTYVHTMQTHTLHASVHIITSSVIFGFFFNTKYGRNIEGKKVLGAIERV